jgi:SAM-dependent methyltransferase
MAGWIRAAAEPIPLAADAWSPTAWPVSDRWLYSFAVRLLWDFAATRGDLDVLQLGEPILGTLPVRHRGRLVSQDLANTALEVKAIRRLLERGPPASILEVGAGYGRTAHALLSLFPEARYTIIDIEPAISISRWYLTRLFPGADLQFLDPRDVASVPDESVDLALSISSLQEMTRGQVKGYLDLMDRSASGGSVYLKQWTEWRNPDDNLVMRFDAFPIPRRWSRRFIEPSPAQRRFTQAGWRIEESDAGESPFEPA